MERAEVHEDGRAEQAVKVPAWGAVEAPEAEVSQQSRRPERWAGDHGSPQGAIGAHRQHGSTHEVELGQPTVGGGGALVCHAEPTSMDSSRGGTSYGGSRGCPSSVRRLLGSPSSSRGRPRSPSSRLDRLGQAAWGSSSWLSCCSMAHNGAAQQDSQVVERRGVLRLLGARKRGGRRIGILQKKVKSHSGRHRDSVSEGKGRLIKHDVSRDDDALG
jgi:hypothetical protein